MRVNIVGMEHSTGEENGLWLSGNDDAEVGHGAHGLPDHSPVLCCTSDDLVRKCVTAVRMYENAYLTDVDAKELVWAYVCSVTRGQSHDC